MPLIDNSDPRPLHFMGIAGAGMSALAELCARRGARVTGCDRDPSGAADLTDLGIEVSKGHDAGHVIGHRALVVSSAIPKDHPEIARAIGLGIPVIRRAEALAEATAGGTLVAIAGTHGKSTTAVMTTGVLAAAGVDPTGVVGARVASWNGNLSSGGNDVFVVEADEYDRSFLALAPDVAVVTNVEADHLDIYRDLDDVREAFEQFVRDARWIVLCADQSGSHHLRTPPSAEVVRYGVSSLDARLVARAIETRDGRTTFDVHFDGVRRGRVSIGAVGLHNVLNALAALGVGLTRFGVSVEQMAPGLASFAGAERRFQRLGVAGGVSVVDDYAHHPTEIRATLSAARLEFPGHRIVIAFQPHLYSRTRDFAADFGLALSRADELFLCDIYPAREQPIPDVSSGLIADSAALAGRRPSWMGSRTGLSAALAAFVKRGDIVLTVGAGDITKTGPELLALLGGTT